MGIATAILLGLSIVSIALLAFIPSFSFSSSTVSAINSAIHTIGGFNAYLPISELIGCVLFSLTFIIAYKPVKILLAKFGINLNA